MRPLKRSTTLVREIPSESATCCCVNRFSAATPLTLSEMIFAASVMSHILCEIPHVSKSAIRRVCGFLHRTCVLLYFVTGNPYNISMSTNAVIAQFHDPARALRKARGAFVKHVMERDGRSARYVATQIGLNPSSMSERLRGKSPFLADELEGIARVMKFDPVEFYRAYIQAGTGTPPQSPEGGVEPPAGLEPATCSLQGDHLGEVIDMFTWKSIA